MLEYKCPIQSFLKNTFGLHESFSSIYCINCIQYGILAKYRKHLSHAHLLNELRSVLGEKAGVRGGWEGREGRGQISEIGKIPRACLTASPPVLI